MPNDVTPGDDLEGEDDVLEEGDDTQDDDDDSADDTDADDSADAAADLVRRLDAVEKDQKTLSVTVNETLKREVGRIQSLADKFEKAPTTANDEALRSEVSALGDIVSEALMAIDDTALDPGAKQKLSAARADIRRRTESDAAKTELMDAMGELIDKRMETQTNNSTAAPASDAAALEQDIMDEIKDSDLDPEDFTDTWTEAATLYKGTDGARAVRRLFRQKIAQALREDGSASRRQTRKAGSKPAPRQTGSPKEDYEQLEGASVADGVEILRRMGINA